MNKDCQPYRDLMVEILDLPADASPDTRKVHEHLAECDSCEQHFTQLREGAAWAALLADDAPAAELDSVFLEAARKAAEEASASVLPRASLPEAEPAPVVSLWSRIRTTPAIAQLSLAAALFLLVSVGVFTPTEDTPESELNVRQDPLAPSPSALPAATVENDSSELTIEESAADEEEQEDDSEAYAIVDMNRIPPAPEGGRSRTAERSLLGELGDGLTKRTVRPRARARSAGRPSSVSAAPLPTGRSAATSSSRRSLLGPNAPLSGGAIAANDVLDQQQERNVPPAPPASPAQPADTPVWAGDRFGSAGLSDQPTAAAESAPSEAATEARAPARTRMQGDSAASLEAGLAAYRAGRWNQAIELLRGLPSFSARLHLARSYVATSQWALAVRAFEQAGIQRRTDNTVREYARALAAAGRQQEADRQLARIRSREDRDVEAAGAASADEEP